jgi:chloramphenicol O-acetyltransferase
MLQATGSVTQANHQSDVSILSIIPWFVLTFGNIDQSYDRPRSF